MVKNFLITGPPGSGKTTLLKELIKELKIRARGFYTEEIRENTRRVGFKIITLENKEGILAHYKFKSSILVSKYRVNLRDLEEIGVKEIEKGIKENCPIVIDEIGKMELFSEKFREAILKALNAKNIVLATIKLTFDPFTDKIKKRKDTKVFYLTRQNSKEIKKEILWHFQNLQQKK